jgi:hypothetical protein
LLISALIFSQVERVARTSVQAMALACGHGAAAPGQPGPESLPFELHTSQSV